MKPLETFLKSSTNNSLTFFAALALSQSLFSRRWPFGDSHKFAHEGQTWPAPELLQLYIVEFNL